METNFEKESSKIDDLIKSSFKKFIASPPQIDPYCKFGYKIWTAENKSPISIEIKLFHFHYHKTGVIITLTNFDTEEHYAEEYPTVEALIKKYTKLF